MLSSDEGAIILDPFIGTGKTALAAHSLKRHFVGIALDKHFCRVAQARLGAQSEPEEGVRYKNS